MQLVLWTKLFSAESSDSSATPELSCLFNNDTGRQTSNDKSDAVSKTSFGRSYKWAEQIATGEAPSGEETYSEYLEKVVEAINSRFKVSEDHALTFLSFSSTPSLLMSMWSHWKIRNCHSIFPSLWWLVSSRSSKSQTYTSRHEVLRFVSFFYHVYKTPVAIRRRQNLQSIDTAYWREKNVRLHFHLAKLSAQCAQNFCFYRR